MPRLLPESRCPVRPFTSPSAETIAWRSSLWREAFGDEVRWKGILEEQGDAAFQQSFRLNTHTGRPLDSDSSLSKLEQALGSRVAHFRTGDQGKREIITVTVEFVCCTMW